MILQSLEELESSLSRGWESVYLLMGAEEYLRSRAFQLLRDRASTKEGADFDVSDMEAGDVDAEDILKASNVFPMLSPRRLVIVREINRLKESEQDALLAGLSTMSSKTVLLLLAADLDKRRKFFKSLAEKYCVCEFQKLKGPALERWASSILRSTGYTISPSGMKKLLEMTGGDLQTLAAELEKLMLFSGRGKSISDTSITDLVHSSQQHSIFELLDAVARGDRNESLRFLENLLGMGEHPLVVVAMLARHCRQILIVKEFIKRGKDYREAGAAAQIPGFTLDKFIKQTRRVEVASVREMYLRLATMDKQLKSSSLDGRLQLEGLICALVNPS